MSRRLTSALPKTAKTLRKLLSADGRADLAEQIDTLILVDRCRCDDCGCATFYTQPNETWDDQQVERIIPAGMAGLICIQVVNARIARVEILNRPDIRGQLLRLLP